MSFGSPNSPSKLRVVVVGQTPPPFHGQGVMTERLVRSRMESVSIYHVRMAFSETMDQVGRFQIGKLFHLAAVILHIAYARLVHRAKVLYYPPAGPNRIPMYRDIVILLTTRWMFPKTVFHFQAGGISTLHAGLSPLMKWLYERAYFQPDAGVRLSRLTPKDATGLQAKREFIIPNCADDERDRFLGDDSKDGTLDTGPERPLRILYLGTVCRTKGILVLLAACRRLRECGIEFHLEVVGSYQPAEFASEVDSTIAEFGLEDCVTMAGQRTGDAKFERLAAADIFCFPTHYESEAFPCVVIEAMSFGLPVVSTHWRGVPGIVEDGDTGFLAMPHDDEGVAAYLTQLAQDATLRHSMGAAGRSRFEAEFTTQRHLELMEQMFLRVGGGKAVDATGNPESSVGTAVENV